MALSAAICDQLGWGAEKPPAVDAARLLKVDLATEMVKEFTSLQGIMGGIYAREEGQPEEVWQAVYDQYMPASAEDRIPRGRAGQVVGLADRLDTLVGIFGLGLIPTGTQGPLRPAPRRPGGGAHRARRGVCRSTSRKWSPRRPRLYGDRLTRERGADPGRPPALPLRPHPLHPGPRAATPTTRSRRRSPSGVASLPDLAARVDALHEVREERGLPLGGAGGQAHRQHRQGRRRGRRSTSPLLVEPAEKELAEPPSRGCAPTSRRPPRPATTSAACAASPISRRCSTASSSRSW